MENQELPQILVVTGGMAAGKSTVAQALAERLPKSIHLRGDIYRKMIVNGRETMGPDLSPEGLRQLQLRYELACHAASEYAAAGFQVVYQDVILGKSLLDVVGRLRRFRPGVVVLDPSPQVLASRDIAREKTAYGDWAATHMRELLHAETPKIGLWIDSSAHTVEQTVAEILAHPAKTIQGM
ncbi:AAA family ATPase [Mesorhizobium sp. BAC0120]|uniref:AAA family ATPase n=1 Tax=Mesorhizobium sp. BAC0120 TaxID=3090670 RepID=UPI00298CEC7F|nr:AAA family ATPase [Mesorhizobium sp. BAC0120]MDW6024495.1 AAA family ATPase [Mesorhizobium sp. BAC0120]